MTGADLYAEYVRYYRILNGGGRFLEWAELGEIQQSVWSVLASKAVREKIVFRDRLVEKPPVLACALCASERAKRESALSQLSNARAAHNHDLTTISSLLSEIDTLKGKIAALRPPEKAPAVSPQRQRTEHIFFLTPERVFARQSDPDESVRLLCESIESSEAVAEIMRYEVPEVVPRAGNKGRIPR